jgi:hypothetical protein
VLCLTSYGLSRASRLKHEVDEALGDLMRLLIDQLRRILAGEVLRIDQDRRVRHAKLRCLHARELLERLMDESDTWNALTNHVDRVTHGCRCAGASSTHADDGVVDFRGELLELLWRGRVPGALLVDLLKL